MAEINIQRKSTPIWPWLVGIIVIALLVWLIVDGMNRTDTKRSSTNSTTNTGSIWNKDGNSSTGSSVSIAAFMTSAEEKDLNNLDITKSPSEGIKVLDAALMSFAGKKEIEDDRIDKIHSKLVNHIDLMKKDEEEGINSTGLRKGFVAASDLIFAIQDSRYPKLKNISDEVSKAAESIDISKPVSSQGDRIKDFFKASGKFLQNINR